jgi:hypothetical protein
MAGRHVPGAILESSVLATTEECLPVAVNQEEVDIAGELVTTLADAMGRR